MLNFFHRLSIRSSFLLVLILSTLFFLGSDPAFAASEIHEENTANFIIEVKKNKMTAKIVNIPLTEVIAKVTKITKIKFSYFSIPGVAINANFKDLSMEEGVSRILEFVDYIIFHEPDARTGQRLKEVRLLSLKKGAPPIPVKKTIEQKRAPQPRNPFSPMREPGFATHPGFGEPVEEEYNELGDLLVEIEEGGKIKKIVKKLRDRDPAVRLKAVLDLTNFEGEMAIDALIIAQDDTDESVSDAADHALDVIDERETMEIVQEDIRDPDPMVRINAIEIVEDYSGDKWVRVLEESLNDEDAKVRRKAARVLKSMTGKEYYASPD